jgi:hypothetical protein
MSGEIEFGKCDICGKQGVLSRKYYHYDIICRCHSPKHFDLVRHCKDCKPVRPMETKITLCTETLPMDDE